MAHKACMAYRAAHAVHTACTQGDRAVHVVRAQGNHAVHLRSMHSPKTGHADLGHFWGTSHSGHDSEGALESFLLWIGFGLYKKDIDSLRVLCSCRKRLESFLEGFFKSFVKNLSFLLRIFLFV